MRVALLACLLLGGCASAAQIAAKDDANCQSWGAQPGSDGYLACRMNLDGQRRQSRAAAGAALMAAGIGMATYQPPPPVPAPGPTVCVPASFGRMICQ